jgi:putative transposase
MRNPLQRRYGLGDLHFITFSCFGRHALLGNTEARNCFVRILAEVRSQYAFLLVGYVVMPEHVHLLISEPKKGDPSKALQVLKQQVSRALLAKGRKSLGTQLSPRFTRPISAEHHFWQRRFYDFNVWTGGKLTEKLDYMHLNPVKRKMVLHPKDWPWSSWSFYATGEQGLIGIDRWESPNEGKENPHP